MSKKKRHNKLTAEQRKALWKPSKENAGAGWQANGDYDRPRYKPYERQKQVPVDEEFK